MKKAFLFIALLMNFSATAATTDSHKFGGGFMIGSITAMTGKYWISKQGALDFGVGYMSAEGVAVYGDYLWHIPGIFGSGTRFGRETSGYIGGGGGVATWSDSYECGRWSCDRRTRRSGTGVFLRGLFGFEWFPNPTQFGVFAELGPTFLLTPSVNGSFDLGIGGRYYF